MSDILEQAKNRYNLCTTGWDEVYRELKNDLSFMSDVPGASWAAFNVRNSMYNLYETRLNAGQPVLQVDVLSQFLNQVVNDIKMNTPSIKAIPNSGKTDKETAEIIEHYLKNVQYESNADVVYDTAVNFSTKCSLGFIKVSTTYENEDTFDQKVVIKRCVNPLSTYIDPTSTEIDGSDAGYGFELENMTVDEFNEKYPGKDAASFGEDGISGSTRKGDEIITIAYYYVVEEVVKYLVLTDTGYQKLDEKPEGEDFREVKERKVMCYKLSNLDMLEDTETVFQYIPIIPVYGYEAWRDGKRYVYSLIRKAKSMASMANLWKSIEAEILLKQPLAPVQAEAGSVEPFRQDWLNPSKAGVLRYMGKDANGVPLNKPERLAPPDFPLAFANASRGAVDDIKSILGMYNATLGLRSNETSGVAIAQRRMEGDVATFHFKDNLDKSIAHLGRVIVSAIPKLIDTKRFIRVIDDEDNDKLVGVNGARAEGQERDYDFTNLDLSVRVVSAPSYTTQRQEAAERYQQLAQTNPQLYNIAGDLIFKYSDLPGSDAIAARMEKLLPPELRDEPQQVIGDVEQAPQMDAEKVQMQQVIQEGMQEIQQMQEKIQQLESQLKSKELEVALKAKENEDDNQIEVARLQLDEQRLQVEREKTLAAIEVKNRELALKEAEMAFRLNNQPTGVIA